MNPLVFLVVPEPHRKCLTLELQPPGSQRVLGHAASAVGAPHDRRVAAAVLGTPVVAALGRHCAKRAEARSPSFFEPDTAQM